MLLFTHHLPESHPPPQGPPHKILPLERTRPDHAADQATPTTFPGAAGDTSLPTLKAGRRRPLNGSGSDLNGADRCPADSAGRQCRSGQPRVTLIPLSPRISWSGTCEPPVFVPCPWRDRAAIFTSSPASINGSSNGSNHQSLMHSIAAIRQQANRPCSLLEFRVIEPLAFQACPPVRQWRRSSPSYCVSGLRYRRGKGTRRRRRHRSAAPPPRRSPLRVWMWLILLGDRDSERSAFRETHC